MQAYAEGGTVSENILSELQSELDKKFTEFMLENANKRANIFAAGTAGIAAIGAGPAAVTAIASSEAAIAGAMTGAAGALAGAAGKLIIFTSKYFKKISNNFNFISFRWSNEVLIANALKR